MTPAAAKRLAELHRQLAEEYDRVASEEPEAQRADPSNRPRLSKAELERLGRERLLRSRHMRGR